MSALALAVEAIVYTFPLFEMARMRSSSGARRNARGDYADPGGSPESTRRWVNVFSHTRHLLGPADRRVVTPNNDTLYTNAWLDLSRGPLIIRSPDTAGRYYVLGFLDFYTNPFAYAGSRTTGTGAQQLFVHGPGWRGQPPAGVTVIASPTDHVWVLGRILASADEDLRPVHALQDAFLITRGDAPGVPLDGEVLDAGVSPRASPDEIGQYVAVVNRELLRNPPPADEAAIVARFSAVGIGPGLSAAIDTALLRAAMGQVLATLDAPQPSELGGGWRLMADLSGSFGRRFQERARVARCYIGMLGVEEVMYLIADVDAAGEPLDGRRDYRLRFAPGGLPDVAAFWSLTMYRKADYLLVDNPLQRYSIGDRTRGLRRDADGGLSLRIGHRPPAATDNWLPAPAEGFYLALRLYLPGAAHVQRSFVYPPLVPA